jgi:hypothetical protein
MQSVAGIFRSRTAGEEAVAGLVSHGVPQASIIFLTAESPAAEIQSEKELDTIPTTDAEADGMGTAVGALMGGGVGATAGWAAGEAIASLLIPGVGPILAVGLGAAALLGLGGAIAGAEVGGTAEHAMDTGVPKDDVLVYRELLKQGRSLVIANVSDEELAGTAKQVLRERGGEDVEHARKQLHPAA